MSGFEGYEMFELHRQQRQREADMERLASLARRLDEQKRSTGLLNAVLNAARTRAEAASVAEVVPVTVLAVE